MIIDCISDLHGHYPKLAGGDLLIVAGDLTARDEIQEHADFIVWLTQQNYMKIVVVAGNHDGVLQNELVQKALYSHLDASHISYLCDSGTTFDGLKIWGSPWTPAFYNWYFMKNRGQDIKKKWDLIPTDTDILITHGPMYGVLDECRILKRGEKAKRAGCEELRKMFDDEVLNPRLHVFGHIHEAYGEKILKGHFGSWDTHCVNACIMNEDYEPVNLPIRIKI